MSDPTTVTALTNIKPNSCVDVKCDCETMWSLVQQDCYLRMTQSTGDFKSDVVENYAARARRISGTYARFYLEQEKGCEPKYKGRFYWMALGAFASKTVACLLETWQIKSQALVTENTKEGLGKGNFWLFCDIAGWHWYYAKYNDHFDQCLDSRDTTTMVKAVQAQTKAMPWSTAALPKIKNLKVSKEIKLGFAKVKAFEGASEKGQPAIQMAHLLAIADHEQGVILQPLIYDDPDFSKWVARQRWPGFKQISPGLELIFNSACEINDPKLKSVAPDGTKLENFESRMSWIGQAAVQFHNLMQEQKNYMESEITKMAGWYNMADKK